MPIFNPVIGFPVMNHDKQYGIQGGYITLHVKVFAICLLYDLSFISVTPKTRDSTGFLYYIKVSHLFP